MKTLLIAINAKFEHEGLAVWYLNQACLNKNIPVKIFRFSINDSMQRIWASILEEQPDVAAFSCYIWNRELVLKLICDLKKAKPDCIVIVGGPEASYEGAEKDFYAFGADFVVKGEGEGKLPMLLKSLEKEGVQGARQLVLDNPDILTNTHCGEGEYISPFSSEYLSLIKDRIAYIESSRGCPYRCSYCLSSESKGFILYRPDVIEADIRKLIDAGAKVIKFVDRSFNVNEKHALAIWDVIRKFSDKNVTFHFEVNPDILTEAQIDSLQKMRPGLVQVEAGIQSVNLQTLKEVSRVMNVEAAIKNIKTLMEKGNIHVHTDLIAGLPYDDFNSFKESFNRIYDIKAHHMQLGFLKLLHGTRIRSEAEKHQYKFRDYPPYEVIENQYMNAEQMLLLKGVEEVLDRTWNSGRLNFTLDYMETFFPTAFDLYESLAGFFKTKGRIYQPMSAVSLFELIREFALSLEGVDPLTLDSYVVLDYACSLKNPVIPEFLKDSKVKALDCKETLESIPQIGWKKEYRKRFLILSGDLPLINGVKYRTSENRILMDTHYVDRENTSMVIVDLTNIDRVNSGRVIIDTYNIDPVTERAIPMTI